MKKVMTVLVLLLLVSVCEGAGVDSYRDQYYDFGQMKTLCILPVEVEEVPLELKGSLPSLVNGWIDAALKKAQIEIMVKPIEKVWKDIGFIYGPLQYEEPFESPESTAFFYDHLQDAAKGSLLVKVFLRRNSRRWIEPRTEIYTVMQEEKKTIKIKESDGKYKEIEIITEVPVQKTRYIPGKWVVSYSARCSVELFDTRRIQSGQFVASASGMDTLGETDEAYLGNDHIKLLKDLVNSSMQKVFPKKAALL